MRVRVLYFAAVRDLVGHDEEEMDLPEGVNTVDAFCTYLAAARPALEGRMGHVRVARNEAFAALGERLEAGDVLALIPPVSGGA